MKLTKKAYIAKKHGKAKRTILKNKGVVVNAKSIVNG